MSSQLTSQSYDKLYYDEHAAAGLDYLGHGFWQESYGLMVTEATQQANYANPVMLDAGCACGSILNGFRKTGAFTRVVGVDLSDHMVRLGREHFSFSENELRQGSIADLPIESSSLSLVHSAQVLEHIPDDLTDPILTEFFRILQPGGRAFLCLDAVRKGETVEMYMGDPTHVNIKPVSYWSKKFQDHGFSFDIEAYNGFVRSSRGPTEGDPRSFYNIYESWSAWTLIKL
jgi:ubiquinone/menaquinone biosynthesis C-methylase UbiE